MSDINVTVVSSGIEVGVQGAAGGIPTIASGAVVNVAVGTSAIPVASAATLGGVKIGSGVSVDANGVISVSIPSMDWDDITDKPSTFPPEAHTHTAADIDSESAADGYVLTADGEGGAAWEQTALSWGDISDKPAALADGHVAIDDNGFLCIRSLNINNPVLVETNAGSWGSFRCFSMEFYDPATKVLSAQTTAWTGTVAAGDVTGLATVATSGSYGDLSGRPTLGTAASAATTDFAAASHSHGNLTASGAIGSTSGQIVVTTTGGALTTAATISASSVSGLAAVATSGGYSSLTGLPTLGTAASQDSTAFAAASHNHAASDVTSGALDAARLPLATTTTAGAVIVGTGLGVASGTISVTQFDVRSDVVSSTAYTGRAVAGSATSASVWTIRRSVYTSAGAVSSTATATNVTWDDRLTATYS